MCDFKITNAACLLLLLTSGATLVAGQSAAQKRQIEEAVMSAGYAIKDKSQPAPSDWEKEQFDLQTKYRLEVRSVKHVPRKPNYFYRYTVDIEVFRNEADAVRRFERLRELPPGMDEKKGAEYLMREGFRRDNRVYIISTNVSMFSYTGLTELKRKLDGSVRP